MNSQVIELPAQAACSMEQGLRSVVAVLQENKRKLLA
jgi:hypothetical protein